MLNIELEISRTPPPGVSPPKTSAGTPILYAYGCALLEIDTGEYYIYKVYNLNSGKTETLGRRKTPLATTEIPKTLERIRKLRIAGTGRLSAERQYGDYC